LSYNNSVKASSVNVLIVKNIPLEGPGTIETYLKSKQISCSVSEYSKGERVHDASSFTHLVVMGGPMAVYEMDRYKHLQDVAKLIEEFLKKEKAVLGICLGAQTMAHVLGGRVYAGQDKEIGWYRVDMTAEGAQDPVFKTLEIAGTCTAEVFQWHGDTFELPPGGLRLASSKLYPNQAFKWGKGSYALQFHIEVTPQIIGEWFAAEGADRAAQMVEQAKAVYPQYWYRAYSFYSEFFKAI
jgi:GMP synthase-like glutamine amidotransferase